jgi:hypothetical protein
LPFFHDQVNLLTISFDLLQVDDEGKGWLNGIDAMIALRGVNNRLTLQEEEYLYRVSYRTVSLWVLTKNQTLTKWEFSKCYV